MLVNGLCSNCHSFITYYATKFEYKDKTHGLMPNILHHALRISLE